MSYEVATVDRWDGGVLLTAQPGVVGPSQLLDALNVEFSEAGSVRQRPGYAKLTTSALTDQPDSITPYLTTGGTKRLLVGNGNRLDVLTGFPGASVANVATTASPHFFVRFGGPTAEVVYIANGTDQVRKLSGTAFSTPAGLSGETGRFLAMWDNRLVIAREGGTTAGNNPSSVRFSDPADPENFTADVFEDLDPGDGEQITGMVTFRELLIVFKETKFYVFDSAGVDADGEFDPSYRRVDNSIGLAASKAVVSARDGVYFLHRNGVYRTTGSDPVPVSGALDPFFSGEPSVYFRSDPINRSAITSCAMGFHQERVFLACPTGSSSTNNRTWVLDPRSGAWSLFDLPIAAMCSFRPAADDELVFCYAAGDNHLGRHSDGYTADDMATDNTGGVAISSRARYGWQDMGAPGVKRVREVRLVGEGACEAKLTNDWEDGGQQTTVVFSAGDLNDVWSTDPADVWTDDPSDVWGPFRQPQPKLVRGGMNRAGAVFSVEFSNSTLNRPWAIHRADFHLPDTKIPSTPESST